MKINCSGSLVKYQLTVKNLNVFAKIGIKTKEFGAINKMLDPLKAAGVEEIDKIFTADAAWSKVQIPLDQYNLELSVDFGVADTFTGKLMSVSVIKKHIAEGATSTEYTFEFEKDAAKEDFNFVIPYLKAKVAEDIPQDSKKHRKPKMLTATFPVEIYDNNDANQTELKF